MKSYYRYFNVNKSDANNHKTRYEFEKNNSMQVEKYINDFNDFLLTDVYTRSEFDYNFLTNKVEEKIIELNDEFNSNNINVRFTIKVYKEALNFLQSLDHQLEYSEKYKLQKNKEYIKDIELQEEIIE